MRFLLGSLIYHLRTVWLLVATPELFHLVVTCTSNGILLLNVSLSLLTLTHVLVHWLPHWPAWFLRHTPTYFCTIPTFKINYGRLV